MSNGSAFLLIVDKLVYTAEKENYKNFHLQDKNSFLYVNFLANL